MAWRDAWKAFPELRTQRLLLRQFKASDGRAYFRNISSVPADIWGGLERESVEHATRSVTASIKGFKSHASIWWAVCKAKGGTLMGLVKLYELHLMSRAEIAYFLGKPYRRRGYMTEALSAVVAWAFDTLELHRIHAYARTDNVPSQKLLAGIGFRKEGVLRKYRRHGGAKANNWRDATWQDMVICAILRDDPRPWRQQAV